MCLIKRLIKSSFAIFKRVNDLVRDYKKPDCAACSPSNELEHFIDFTDETYNVESSSGPEDNNRSNTTEKGTNTAIIWNQSRKTRTEKTEIRTFPRQTHLQLNKNYSLFEKSASLQNNKEVQTEGEVFISFQAQSNDEQTTAMPTEIPQSDDNLPTSQREMNDCITTSDTILDEFGKNSSDADFTSLTESSNSKANSHSEDDLEQENIIYPLSRDKPASEQIKIVIFEEAVVNAFRNCLKCGEACTVSLD